MDLEEGDADRATCVCDSPTPEMSSTLLGSAAGGNQLDYYALLLSYFELGLERSARR